MVQGRTSLLDQLLSFISGSLIFFCLIFCAPPLFAGPPFITDDPGTTPLDALNVYLFAFPIAVTHSTQLYAPGIELDYGMTDKLELHVMTWMTSVFKTKKSIFVKNATGFGDMELNAKYRLIDETKYFPSVAIVPALELPTGNAERGLGNGRTWSMFPIWFQKSIDTWTIFTGGGYAFNSAPGVKNYPFGGFLVEDNVTDNLMLGGELYAQGNNGAGVFFPDLDAGSFLLLDLGGSYQLNKNTAILFMAGHSVTGVKQWVSYVGINWVISKPFELPCYRG